MSLVHVTTVPATLGFLRGQLGFMRSHGFDVHVITTPGPGLNRFAIEEQVQAHGIAMERRMTPMRDLIALWKLFRLLRAIRPDVVHASTPKGGLLGVIAARLARVPLIVYQVRGLPFTGMRGTGRSILMLTERIACSAAHQVLAVSASLCDELLASKITSSGKLAMLGSGSSNGVAAEARFNPSNFPPGDCGRVFDEVGIPEEAQVVGFVGRLVKDKGLLELTTAWKTIAREYPKAWLLVIGDWEPRDAVPAYIREELTSHSRVRFMGNQDQVARFYLVMDFVVLPTFREGFPNVPLEAAAMERPVITTLVTGAVDAVVGGVTGMLIPAGDADALASAMRAYLDNPQMQIEHGRAGRARVLKDFRPTIIWEATLDKYVEWLGKRGVSIPTVNPIVG